MSSSSQISYSAQFRFPTPERAQDVKAIMEVDREISADKVTRSIEVQGSLLTLSFKAEYKFLKVMRTAVNGFLTNLGLVLQTIDEFGGTS